MVTFFQQLLHLSLDIFLPRRCVGCGIECTFLCMNCHASVPQKAPLILESSCLEMVYIAHSYNTKEVIGKLIKKLKYQFSQELAKTLVELSAPVLCDFVPWKDIECFAPVPLSDQRLKWRGFNQAEILAQYLGQKFDIPVCNIFKKVRHTKVQAHLSRVERLKNLENAFAVQPGTLPKSVCIIDDVYTTGATMQACARTLRNAGVEHVFGLAIAKKTV